MKRIFVEPAPIIAPGVVDEYDAETGEFRTRWYDGEKYDQNGDRIYEEESSSDE